MSPKIQIPSLAAGLLSVLGLAGIATLGAAAPQDPKAAATAPAPAEGQAPPAPSGPPTVLLLTNGKVLQGEILQDATGYVLKHKIGVMQFPRRNVEKTFHSVPEVYAYKLSLCPENDPDERLKLAMWCLDQKMKAEARAQLSAALELSPDNRRVKAMLASLDRDSIAMKTAPDRDAEVQRAGAERIEMEPAADQGLNRLREEFARNPRAAGTPAIFDLEAPLAVRRFQEFARYVHPVLQRRCARCHNEQSTTEFQLIQTRANRDMANDLIVRTNMDATLRIIDRDDLMRSPLLTSSGMTHGSGGKPVLGGPNSPEYRVLASWVNSLRAASMASPAGGPAKVEPGSTPPREAFAAGRRAPGNDPAMPPANPQAGPRFPGMATPPLDLPEDRTDANTPAVPAGSLLPGSAVGLPANNPPPPSKFEVPTLDTVRRQRQAPAAGTEPANPSGAQMMRDPVTGELIPIITPEMTTKKKDAPGKKKVNLKDLDGYMKAKATGK